MDESPSKNARRGQRRWLRIVFVIIILFVALIALLPTAVSLGLGQGHVRNAIAANVNGQVELDDIGLSWFGDQRVEGLRIIDDSGREAVNLTASLENSLLSLAFGRAEPMRVSLSGSLAGEIRDDGSLSFADLIRSEQEEPRTPKQPDAGSTRAPARSIPLVEVKVEGLSIDLNDRRRGQAVKISNLQGTIAHTHEAQPITIDLHGDAATTIAGRTESGEIDIAGEADGLFAADGTLSLRGAAAEFKVVASGMPLPVDALTGGKPATLAALNVALASDDLTERIAINVEGLANVHDTTVPTTFKIDGSVNRIIDGHGALSLRAAGMHLTAEAGGVPIEASEVRGVMRALTATIVSDDLTQRVEIAARGEGTLNNDQKSELSVNLSLAHPFAPDGAFTFAIENLTGSASGKRVPTSLAEPALMAMGIDPQRDLGATMDLEAFFPGGMGASGGELMIEARAPKASAEVAARINSDRSITGSKLMVEVPSADPALIASLTGGAVFSDRPLGLQVNLSSFSLPAKHESGTMALGLIAATGSISISGPANIGAPPVATDQSDEARAEQSTQSADQPLIQLEQFDFDIETPGLAQYVSLDGRGTIGGGSIEINERIANLLDESGVLSLAQARPEGSIRINGLPAATVLAFTPDDHAEIVGELIGSSLSADIETNVNDAGLRAEMQARTDAVTAAMIVTGRDDEMHSAQLDRLTVDATISPRAAELLQEGASDPVVLGAPTRANIEIKPVLLPMGAAADVLSTPVSGTLRIDSALIERAPGIAQPMHVAGLATELSVVRRGSVLSVNVFEAALQVLRGEAASPIQSPVNVAHVSLDGVIAIDTSGGATAIRPDLNLQLNGLKTRQAESLLGLSPGAVAIWTGDEGDVTMQVESTDGGYIARATPTMPNIEGTFTASIGETMMTVTADTNRLVFSREALEAQLNPAPIEGPSASASTSDEPRASITVEDDVPAQLQVREFELPLAMIRGEAFDSAQVGIDLELSGGPFRTTMADGATSTLSDLKLSARTDDLRAGITFAMNGRAQAVIPREPIAEVSQPPSGSVASPMDEADMTPEQRREARREARAKERADARAATQPAEAPSSPDMNNEPNEPMIESGTIDVQGVVTKLVNSEGMLSADGAVLQMNAELDNVPSVIADVLGDMHGLLVAAIGPQMDATFVADDFSTTSGTLDADIHTTNGSLSAVLRGREQSFRINRNGPLKAELEITSPLRERLLARIHPILADIRTTEQPLRVTIPTALAAIPADVSQLRADIEITVGKVELDSGSTTLKILSLFGKGDRRTVPGEIEPIRAKIHNGIVTYEKFAVRIDRYTLNYSGEIDLVKQEVRLRTEIPLKALGESVEELAGYADAISVPLITRGKFGDLKTTIDPDFDLGKAAIDAGFKGAIGNLLGGDGSDGESGVGGILDRVLNKDRDEETSSEPATQPRRPRPRSRESDPATQPSGSL